MRAQISSCVFVFLLLRVGHSLAGPCKPAQSFTSLTASTTSTVISSQTETTSTSTTFTPTVATDSASSTASADTSTTTENSTPEASATPTSTPSVTTSSTETQFSTLSGFDSGGNEVDLSLTYVSASTSYILANGATYTNSAIRFGIDTSGRFFATLSDGTLAWAVTTFPSSAAYEGFHFMTDDVLSSAAGSGYNYVSCEQNADGYLDCSSEAGGAIYFISPSNSLVYMFVTSNGASTIYKYYNILGSI